MKEESLKYTPAEKSIKTKRKRHDLKLLSSNVRLQKETLKPTVLMVTTFPPRECGIATYSQDLINSLSQVFGNSFQLEICPLYDEKNPLSDSRKYGFSLNTEKASNYRMLADKINADNSLELVMVQHEFGLFNGCTEEFTSFLKAIKKPIILCFHTVIPQPNKEFLKYVQTIGSLAECIVVMTQKSKELLVSEYNVRPSKIDVINHGTHLVKYKSRVNLKTKYGLEGKTVLSTFGLLGPGKCIETTLNALPEIVTEFPDVLFLILGKSHPNLVKSEGELYRGSLVEKIKTLHLEEHVKFVNEFLPIEKLLDYLQLTDIYLFTSKDPNQAVSGTFAYAMSCGCPIISTPIPHAQEFLSENKGLLFDFGNSKMLTEKLQILLRDPRYRKNLGRNGLHASSATSWQNSALLHGWLFEKLSKKIHLNYTKPDIKLDHLIKMTTSRGLIQFCNLNQPDFKSGHTLDDNARALIVICQMYRMTKNHNLLEYLIIYVCFIFRCQRCDGTFLNYVDIHGEFTNQNDQVNLEDSNGRAIWALGQLLAIQEMVSNDYDYIFERAKDCFNDFLPNIPNITSPRSMAFIIKGIKTSGLAKRNAQFYDLVLHLGKNLVNFYEHEKSSHWKWFESSLTYGNSVLPEALIEAYKVTHLEEFKLVALNSFNFLLRLLFKCNEFKVISNNNWFHKGDSIQDAALGGQQPIDVAYTILALKSFHDVLPLEKYEEKMELAFSWFLGNNHLKQIIYNPCTTGCFDGLETTYVNLNQGAESTISYLLARLAFVEFPESD